MRTSTQSLANAVPTHKPLPTSLPARHPTPDQRRKHLWRVPPAIAVCLLIATFLTLAALLTPWLAPSNPTAQKLLARLRPPVPLEHSMSAYILGTDELGRDLLSRCLYGMRVTLGIAAFGMVIGLGLGTSIGLVSGFVGGRLDSAMMMLADMQIAIPFLLVALFAIAIFGTGLTVLIIVVGIAGWASYARKVDDYTVRVFTKRPDPLFEILLAVQQANIVPKAYITGLSGHAEVDEVTDYEQFGLAPIGTGPYKITTWRPGELIVWERFEDFWGEKPTVKKITVRRIPELAARITGLMTGELDLITNLPPDQVAAVEKGTDTKVVGALTPLFHVVFYNAQHPKMTKKIRQALNLAIDRQLLVDALWKGKAVVPPHHTFPQYGPLYDPNFQILTYAPERTKQLLREATHDGFEITFDTHPTYYTNGLLAAQALKEMWEAVGVTLRIRVDERWTGSDPDMMARNWSNPMYFPDPVGSYGTMWSPTGARITAGTWKPEHPDYNVVWDKFRFSLDPKQRLAYYKEILKIADDEAPFTILYQPYESYGLRKHVHWQPLPGHIPYVLDFRHGNLRLDAVTAAK